MVQLPAYPRTPSIERCLDLLFPPVCVGCRRAGRWICAHCWPNVDWVLGAACVQCGTPCPGKWCGQCQFVQSDLDLLLTVARFDGLAREAVHGLKYHGHHAMSGLMGRLMAETAGSSKAQAVLAVPLHKSRRRERGYDQAQLLARAISRETGVPRLAATLRRTRPTSQQAKLDQASRAANVAGAFVAINPVEADVAWLVDDVMTTGATINEAAKALKAGGVKHVIGLVFASA